MIGIGIVGIGFMGSSHFVAMRSVEGAQVTAIATRDESKWSGDWRGIGGNYGADGGVHDLSQVATYRHLDELLEDPAVHVVDLCLPTSLHKEASIRALEAGKHVLVEKPIALTLEDAQAMLSAADRAGRRLFVAHVLRFMPPYRSLHRVLESGIGGDVLGITMKRTVSAPWSTPMWRQKLEQSGGPLYDLFVHDADFLRHLFGMPTSVAGSGYVHEGRVVHYQVTLRHGEQISATVSGGITGMPARPFEQGYAVHLKHASLHFDSTAGGPPLLIRAEGEPQSLPCGSEDPIASELQYVVDELRNRHPARDLDGWPATQSLAICVAADQAIRAGRIIRLEEEPIASVPSR